MLDILDNIAKWIPANGEGIYGTRPWKIYGEGPSINKQEKGRFGGVKDVRPYESTDIRFTTKGDIIYAFCMGSPKADIKISSLAKNSKLSGKTVKSIKMMGGNEKLKWSQKTDALIIGKSLTLSDWQVVGFKIEFNK